MALFVPCSHSDFHLESWIIIRLPSSLAGLLHEGGSSAISYFHYITIIWGFCFPQAVEDKKAEMEGVVEIPQEGSEEDIIAAVVKNVLWQMDADRKTTALKKLQGQMWRQGYKSGELKGQ